ncbi:MAG: radical SAM protein [Spirochaetales bacterium]|nr:radical SAM protein [Spirochaetales bacterium]
MPPSEKPKVLLVQPPIYDFALYDLFLKPAGLLSVGYSFAQAGYDTRFVNGLDYTDPVSSRLLGRPARKADGTGKFFRRPLRLPEALRPAGRAYARYGLHPEVFRKRILKAFGKDKPDLILLGTGMTYWYPGVRETAETLRELFPGVPVFAGGVYATLLPEHCERVCAVDAAIRGPAAPGLREPLARYGLPPIDPEPEDKGYRVLMDTEVWKDAGVLLLNRGCPYDCAYCASSLVSGPFSPGDPEVLYETLKAMHRTAGTKHFAFYDDALLVRKEEVLYPFLDKVLRSGSSFSFYLPNAVHIALLDRETAMMLKKAGFREIRLGLESSSPVFHSLLDGKVSKPGFDDTLEVLKEAGFSSGDIIVYILAGLPEQAAEEVEESIRFVKSRGVRISLSEYSPVPGSPLWARCLHLSGPDLEREPLWQNNTFFPMEWKGFTREDLRRMKRDVWNYNAAVIARSLPG